MTTTAGSNKSGLDWWNKHKNKTEFANSTSIEDLESRFKANVKAFKRALEDGGATVAISATRRSRKRAYVFHYAWAIAKLGKKASTVPSEPGVDIEWEHGDEAKSKEAAQKIVTAAGLAYQASLSSRHISGKAIDWTITWTGDLEIAKKDGTKVKITSTPRHGGKGSTHNGNTELHAVGKTYGVIKANFSRIDGPHWSTDGK